MSRYSITVLIDAPDRRAADQVRSRILEVSEGAAVSVSASDPMTEAEVA